MANPEHLAKLKEGVEAWNQWRLQNPGIEPDLVRANLSGASLIRADLSSADLFAVELSKANLSEADLTRAFLGLASFIGANLFRATLTNAALGDTVLGDTNLNGAKGLENCEHLGPSIIDYQTLSKSGPLPLAFLRGCGLPDALIDYQRSVLSQPIRFYSCFISYSTRDKDFADRLHADLQNKGVRCWFAPEDLKIGDPFRQRIDEAIRVHEKLLLILSEHSVQSDWVQEEVESCLERESREKRPVLFPVRLDDAVIDTNKAWAASIRRQRHIGDFRAWKRHNGYQEALEGLLRDLKAENPARGSL